MSINFGGFDLNNYAQLYANQKGITVDQAKEELKNQQNASQKSNEDVSIFDKSKDNAEYEADKAQLAQDYAYFSELLNSIQSGDYSVVDEINQIELGKKVENTDENAIQYNKNTDLLSTLKNMVKNLFKKDEAKEAN